MDIRAWVNVTFENDEIEMDSFWASGEMCRNSYYEWIDGDITDDELNDYVDLMGGAEEGIYQFLEENGFSEDEPFEWYIDDIDIL